MAHWRSRGLSAPGTSPLSRRPSHEGVGRLNWSRSRRASRVHAPGSRPDVEGPRPGVLVGGPGERQARAVPLPVGVAATAAEVGAGPATSAAATRGRQRSWSHPRSSCHRACCAGENHQGGPEAPCCGCWGGFGGAVGGRALSEGFLLMVEPV
jgi:hypothetical protein